MRELRNVGEQEESKRTGALEGLGEFISPLRMVNQISQEAETVVIRIPNRESDVKLAIQFEP